MRIGTFIGLFFLVAPVTAKLISHMIGAFHRHHDTPGLIPTTMVALVLIFAGLAHYVGAPELLGGFAAGLALSRRFFLPFGIALAADHHFSDLILAEMKPIVRLFTPIFFVMVGLSLDLRLVDWGAPGTWGISFALLTVAIAGKFGGALVLREPWTHRTAIGMGMVPRGEVGLVFAELGRTTGMLDPATYAILVLVIAYTTLLAPFWIKSFYKRHAGAMEPSISEPGHQYSGPAGATVGPGPARD
jgi:Kef-type K+ transport system membrane component KefB